jgi:serine/threonine-protein kinase
MEEKYIGNYRILEKIGAGGMARVYLAVHKDVPNLKVVLKVLSDPRLADRFRQEADKLALLDGHPNICRIKHFFNHGDDFVIAMDHIDGRTVEEIIDAEGPLPPAEALRIIDAVLSILQAAHDKDIYHRDIKPGNIMIDKAGQVKIIDFGIAKSKTDPNLTIAGTATGTPSYMAPEQFAAAEGIDYAKCDLYAVGSTLFKILTGQLPFTGDNEFALRDAKLFNEPIKPSSLNQEIDKTLEKVILKAISKEPEDRFASAGEMKQALASAAGNFRPEEKGPVATATETPTPKPSIAPRRKKLSFWPIAITLAAIVIVFVVVYKFILTGDKPIETSVQETPVEDADTTTASPAVMPSEMRQGVIDVSAVPYGDIYLDGELIRATTGKLVLTRLEGRHIVRVENQKALGKKVYVDTIEVVGDATIEREYTFNIPARARPEEPVPEEKLYGKILAGSRPRGADIYIDGELQEQTTPYTFDRKAGQHVVRLVLKDVDGQEHEKVDTVTVEPGRQVKVLFEI